MRQRQWGERGLVRTEAVRHGRLAAAMVASWVLLAGLGGCAATAPAAGTGGSPPPGLPGTTPAPMPARPSPEPIGIETTASATLQAAILRGIARNEASRGRSGAPRLLAAGPLGKRGTTVVERWIVDSNGERVAYNVDLTPATGGGTSISIQRVSR